MLPETEVVAAIDVGTTKVCTVVGRRLGTKGIDVLGYSSVPCSGVRKGNVSDLAATSRAVRDSVDKVEESTGFSINSAFVGVTGPHVGFENRKDRLSSVGNNGVITASDMKLPIQLLAKSVQKPGRELIHAVRMTYSLDGESGIRNPVGMHSSDVEVETHFVTGGTAFVQMLVKAVEGAGITIKGLVLEPLASGLAVLSTEEKERGTLMLDIGGGTTDVVGFRRGRIYYCGVIPVGGHQFTNDIAVTFNTPYAAAEAAKLQHASAEIHAARSDEFITLPVVGRIDEIRVQRQEICQLARERAMELARMVKVKLDSERVGPDDVGLVLTGGASNMPGLAAVMQKNLSIPVRQGVPNVRGVIPGALRDPVYATGLGILLWAVTEYVSEVDMIQLQSEPRVGGNGTGIFGRFLKRLQKLVPMALFVKSKGRI